MTTTRCYEIRNKAFEYETGGTAISCAKADGAAPRHRRSERHFRNNISRRRGATNVFGLRCRSARAKRVDTLIWRISLPLLPFIHLTSIVSTFFLSVSQNQPQHVVATQDDATCQACSQRGEENSAEPTTTSFCEYYYGTFFKNKVDGWRDHCSFCLS